MRNLLNATATADIKVSLTDHVGMRNNTQYNPTELASKKEKHHGRGGRHIEPASDDDEATEKIIRMKGQEWVQPGKDPPSTNNPNFGQIITIRRVDLTEDPILWPYVKMQVYESGRDSGIITSQAIVPLFLYAD